MKRRIAEIITKFSSEGLAELRRAIRGVSDDARRQHINSDRAVGAGLKTIRKESIAAADAARRLQTALDLKDARRGLFQVGRGLAQISTGSLSLSKTGIVATTESISVSAKTIQKSFSLIGQVAKRQFATVEISGKKAFRRLAVESRLASRVIESDIVVATRRAGTQALGFMANAPGIKQLATLRRSATTAFAGIAAQASIVGPQILRPFQVASRGIVSAFAAARPAIVRALDLGGEAVRAAGRITKGFANVGTGVARSLTGIAAAATRTFAGVSQSANRAFGGIVRGAGRMAGQSIKDLAKIPLGILREMGSEQVILYSAIGAAAAAVYAAWPAIKGFGALGIAGLAGAFTVADLKIVRQAAEALDITPQQFQAFQHVGNSLGIASEEMAGGLQQLQSAMTASLDPESDENRLFQILGINPRDASGKLKPIADVLGDIAQATSRMTKEQQNFTLETLLGDAQTFSELMRRLREDEGAFNTTYAWMAERGLFTSTEEVELIHDFRISLQDLLGVLRAGARELFLAFIPVFEKFQDAFVGALDTVEKRQGVIDAFVRAWVEGFQLFNDFMRVFVGYDVQKQFLGEDSGEIQNTWLVTLKKVLLDTWTIIKAVGQALWALGSLFYQVFAAVDELVTRFTGFNIEHWIKTTGAEDVLAFFTDLRKIIQNLFQGPFDTSQLETALGRFMGDNAEKFKDALRPVGEQLEEGLRYIETAIAEANASAASGSGLSGAETTLGQLIILAREAAIWLGELGKAFQTVFLEDGAATGRMEWLNSLKTAFDHVRDVANDIAGILGPLFAAFDTFTKQELGINGATALVLGKVGLDIASSAPLPVALVAIAGGVAALFYNWLKPDAMKYVTDNGAAKNVADRERMDRDLDAAGGPRPEQLANYARTSADYDERDRSFIRTAIEEQESRIRDREAAEIAASVEGTLANVDVTATGTPVVINLPSGGTATGIFPSDQADELQRSLQNSIGGR